MDDAIVKARKDTVEGFEAFYLGVHGKCLPPHCSEWIVKIYDAKSAEKGLVVEAFRGSTKTTTFGTYMAYVQGLRPAGTSLAIQASDDAVKLTGDMVANIIEHNAMFKACFPHVVPDKESGWSAAGYDVKRDDIPYDQWKGLTASKRDPSIAFMSYDSKALPGFHPSNFLWVDDIHTEQNTASARELAHVKKVISGTVFPMRLRHRPLTVFTGTPWTDEDILQFLKQTGEYLVCQTKVYRPDGTPTWPEFMNKEQIEAERRQDMTGGLEFARNFLLDLTAAQNRVFVYHLYPSHLINVTWPMVNGVDYAGIADPAKRTSDHSHFALAYVAKLPGGGAVIYDGVLEQTDQATSEEYVVKAQEMFPSLQHTVVEGDGVGEQFFQVLYRHPGLRLVPMKTKGVSKAERLAGAAGLAPWLRYGRVRISDAETKFLNALRHFLNNYPNVGQHDPGWDAADAVYWALKGMPDVLIMPDEPEDIWSPVHERAANPFGELAQQHG